MNYQDLARMILAGEVRPMTGDDTQVILTCHAAEERMEGDEEVVATQQQRIFGGRAEGIGLQMPTTAVRLALECCIPFRSPGLIVMTLAVVKHLTASGRKLTMHDMCFGFARGFPTEAVWSAAWAAQKMDDGRNRVDTLEFWN